MALDSDNLQRAEAQFRGTQASAMVPMSTEPTHMIRAADDRAALAIDKLLRKLIF